VVVDSATMYGQSESLLKKWNLQDPPDNYEIARNDYIQSIQSNRNPFIDHPEWVNWFGFGVFSSINTINTSDVFGIYPNPNNGKFSIQIGNTNDVFLEVFDLKGVEMYSAAMKNNSVNSVDLSKLSPGIYFYQVVISKNLVKNGKLVIQ
jgi:hypothetical protein